MNSISENTNILEAYAGYYLDDRILRNSSSGGAASALSEWFIEQGGCVYGAIYSDDFYSAHYKKATKKEDLQQFKGSKYVYVEKIIKRSNKIISIYEDIVEVLKKDEKVLFIGLGCDVAAIKNFINKQKFDDKNLFTIELLCDGVTNSIVHEKYIIGIERIYNSKVVEFTVRHKRDGWTPLYVYAKLENGKEHIVPFYESDYGYAFLNYKRKACYQCCIKDKKHRGDIMLGDYWGCRPGMQEYQKNGVSLVFIQSAKGKELLNGLNEEYFWKQKIDENYALYYSPRYTTSHDKYYRWKEFDFIVHESGLREAVRKTSGVYQPRSYDSDDKKIAVWGTGNCFHRLVPFIEEHYTIDIVVDSNSEKWGQMVEYGYLCKSPENLIGNGNIFVLILIDNIQAAFQVVNQLLDMQIYKFDYVQNWLKYY